VWSNPVAAVAVVCLLSAGPVFAQSPRPAQNNGPSMEEAVQSGAGPVDRNAKPEVIPAPRQHPVVEVNPSGQSDNGSNARRSMAPGYQPETEIQQQQPVMRGFDAPQPAHRR
jgi:hypothetical protein